MAFKFPKQHEGDLEFIKSFFETHFCPNAHALKDFSDQLKKIDSSLNESISESNTLFQKNLGAQKELVRNLVGRCHKLKVRRDVIEFAEDAENLANSSPNLSKDQISKEADLLRQKIESFLKDHRPSKTNAKFLRFAKALIEKAL